MKEKLNDDDNALDNDAKVDKLTSKPDKLSSNNKSSKNGKEGCYQCQFCDKSFPRLGYLKKHEQVSSDKKLFLVLKYRLFIHSFMYLFAFIVQIFLDMHKSPFSYFVIIMLIFNVIVIDESMMYLGDFLKSLIK